MHNAASSKAESNGSESVRTKSNCTYSKLNCTYNTLNKIQFYRWYKQSMFDIHYINTVYNRIHRFSSVEVKSPHLHTPER